MRQIARFLVATTFTALAIAAWFDHGIGETVHPSGYVVYVGTYTRQQSRGIYAFRFDPAAGKAATVGLAAEAENPSFLAIHPNRQFLYAVNEISNFQGRRAGSISAYRVGKRPAMLQFINRMSTQGDSPCHVTVDRTGIALFVANYGAGSVASIPIMKDGSLSDASSLVEHAGSSVNPQRQQGPHAHEVVLSPDGRLGLVPDLGLDKVFVYGFDRARIAFSTPPVFAAKLEPGSGPRHLAFRPDGKYTYVVNELRSTVTVFAYSRKEGSLTELQTASTLPKDFAGTSTCAEIAVHPNGRFLYASNRGHDSIAVFAINRSNGTVVLQGQVPTQGKTPRHFAIDPTGGWLLAANQGSNNVVVFRIDARTGQLAPTGEFVVVPSPSCIIFVAS
ncbi:MAG: lactonase family protein [Acidobacteriia bacterium]|nr:lactonase family protein [Terriglobia bacterium]